MDIIITPQAMRDRLLCALSTASLTDTWVFIGLSQCLVCRRISDCARMQDHPKIIVCTSCNRRVRAYSTRYDSSVDAISAWYERVFPQALTLATRTIADLCITAKLSEFTLGSNDTCSFCYRPTRRYFYGATYKPVDVCNVCYVDITDHINTYKNQALSIVLAVYQHANFDVCLYMMPLVCRMVKLLAKTRIKHSMSTLPTFYIL